MKLVLALVLGLLLQTVATAGNGPTSGLALTSLAMTAAVQSKGFPKPPRPPAARTGIPKPPKPKSGFEGTRKKLADKTVGKGRPKEKLDELNRRQTEGNLPEGKSRNGNPPERTSQTPAKKGEAGDAPGNTDLSPENHVRALRLELHAMKEELTLKAKKDGVKLRSLADDPEADMARFIAFKVQYYQDLCRWLETCDVALREGKGLAAGLRAETAKAAAKSDAKEVDEKDEDAKSYAVLRRRFLEFQAKSQGKLAGKEDRPLLQRFHQRLAGHATAVLADD